jgi:hypothetical protein
MGIYALFTGLSLEKIIDPIEVDEALFGETLALVAVIAVVPKS